MKRVSPRILNLVGGTFVAAGLVVLVVAAQVRQSNVQTQAQPPVTAANSVRPAIKDKTVKKGEPTELVIQSVGIRNQIISGVFDQPSGQWTLTLDKVQHAVMTYQPNDKKGLTFLYGHNRAEVFARLPAIQEGAEALVKTDNGYVFRYRFISSTVTTPDDVSIFAYDGPPVLVLQTCTGLFFQNRQLFTFELVGVGRA